MHLIVNQNNQCRIKFNIPDGLEGNDMTIFVYDISPFTEYLKKSDNVDSQKLKKFWVLKYSYEFPDLTSKWNTSTWKHIILMYEYEDGIASCVFNENVDFGENYDKSFGLSIDSDYIMWGKKVTGSSDDQYIPVRISDGTPILCTNVSPRVSYEMSFDKDGFKNGICEVRYHTSYMLVNVLGRVITPRFYTDIWSAMDMIYECKYNNNIHIFDMSGNSIVGENGSPYVFNYSLRCEKSSWNVNPIFNDLPDDIQECVIYYVYDKTLAKRIHPAYVICDNGVVYKNVNINRNGCPRDNYILEEYTKIKI